MPTRLTTALSAAAIGAATVVVPLGTPAAHADVGSCAHQTAGYALCVWGDRDYNGGFTIWYADNNWYGSFFWHADQSWYNRSYLAYDAWVSVYGSYDTTICLAYGQKVGVNYFAENRGEHNNGGYDVC